MKSRKIDKRGLTDSVAGVGKFLKIINRGGRLFDTLKY